MYMTCSYCKIQVFYVMQVFIIIHVKYYDSAYTTIAHPFFFYFMPFQQY